jgi:ammonia channel protein AmtB
MDFLNSVLVFVIVSSFLVLIMKIVFELFDSGDLIEILIGIIVSCVVLLFIIFTFQQAGEQVKCKKEHKTVCELIDWKYVPKNRSESVK